MKLFHKICIWVFSGMMGLSLGILFFLLSSMLRQGVDDVICYGKKEIDKNVSVIREKIQRESIGTVETVVKEIMVINEFRQIFKMDSILWKDGEEVWNASPYEIDRSALSKMFKSQDLHSGEMYISRRQKVDGKILIVFYQEYMNLGENGYSLAVYRDVTDIYSRVWKLFFSGVGFTIVLFCTVGALLYHGIRRILFPLEELKGASFRVENGEYDSYISITNNDEIGEVTESFNQMAEKIREHMKEEEMMNKKMAVIASLLISTNMLSGCAKTPGTPVVRPKGEHAMEHYKEADEAVKTQSTVSENLLQTRLDIPAHYKNEVSDITGKLNVFTDADLVIPEVETVPAIYVKRHESDQEDIDAITRALFGNADVYDLHGKIEEQRSYETAPEKRELSKLTAPYEFKDELIDPYFRT